MGKTFFEPTFFLRGCQTGIRRLRPRALGPKIPCRRGPGRAVRVRCWGQEGGSGVFVTREGYCRPPRGEGMPERRSPRCCWSRVRDLSDSGRSRIPLPRSPSCPRTTGGSGRRGMCTARAPSEPTEVFPRIQGPEIPSNFGWDVRTPKNLRYLRALPPGSRCRCRAAVGRRRATSEASGAGVGGPARAFTSERLGRPAQGSGPRENVLRRQGRPPRPSRDEVRVVHRTPTPRQVPRPMRSCPDEKDRYLTPSPGPAGA